MAIPETGFEQSFTTPNQHFYKFAHAAVSGYIRARGGLNIVGLENFNPGSREVVTANHDRKTDPFAIGISYPEILFTLGKKELWTWRNAYVGKILGRLGSVALNRINAGHNTMKKAADITIQGGALLTFLEGTRKNKGGDIKGKDGVAWIALHTADELEEPCPIIPVGLSTSHIRLGYPIQEVIGEPILAQPGSTTKMARKALTKEIETSIYDLRVQALKLDAAGAGQRFQITRES